MKKKIISILVCTVTILSLVGCGDSSSKETATSSNSTSASDSADKKDTNANDEKKTESKVIFDDEFAKVTYTGVDRDGAMGPEINLEIENKGDKDITVQVGDISVDNSMEDTIFSCDVVKGKNAKDSITFTNDKMDKNFKSVEGKFIIIDKNDITSTLKEEPFKLDC